MTESQGQPKFTPGPWRFGEDRKVRSDFCFDVFAANDTLILRLSARESANGFESAEANARLIARAPDMYHACDAVADALQAMVNTDVVEEDRITDCVVRLRRAIAGAV